MICSRRSISSLNFSLLLKLRRHSMSSSCASEALFAPTRIITKELNTSRGEKHMFLESSLCRLANTLKSFDENVLIKLPTLMSVCSELSCDIIMLAPVGKRQRRIIVQRLLGQTGNAQNGRMHFYLSHSALHAMTIQLFEFDRYSNFQQMMICIKLNHQCSAFILLN